MFCPKCRSEFVKGISECPDCKIKLVEKLPEEEFLKFVTLFSTGNSNLMAIVKSILDDAKMQYFVKNEKTLDIIGAGRFGFGYNPLTGMMELLVDKDDKEEAKMVLKDLLEEPDIIKN